ncbi:hypothetical protein [Bifidobacterium sp.]|jgi:hypothetical protein|uniref:hypothetical protein n=1 Tax=Bifidobacterium sp. TaxID=41200 RepID=UPI0025C4FE9F|nr:hypothetical protein [Bifidobacterium sp.]MCH4209867.1 hypothetical protein [Bifidobacterium sp.]MCI1224496.1 hypothetical protein [Bifidobacterium sp.]
MIQTLEKQKAAAIAVAAARDYEPTYQQDRPTTLARYPHLEMTRAMSRARILNVLFAADMDGVIPEETERMRQLEALCEWSLLVLGRQIHTQADRNRFIDSYQLVVGSQA